MYSFFVVISAGMAAYLVGLILWDIWSTIWPKCMAEVQAVDYKMIDRGGKAEKWYDITLQYNYKINDVTYASSGLNVFGNVIRMRKHVVAGITGNLKRGDKIFVHVCPMSSKIAYAFPLRSNLLLVVFYFWITFGVLFCAAIYNHSLHGYYFFE